jgi:dTDP-4-amino-4,6-dideoxygalactose transaminase
MKDYKIWLSLAEMGGGEQKYIQEAFDTNWVVPLGPNVDVFERTLENYIGNNKHVVTLSSGTAAVHLGLKLLGVGTDDEVICQSFTFAASANPIVYLGAKPVFVDSEADTWNISPVFLEEAILDRKKKTGKCPKAIITVCLYGMPAKMDKIMAIANKYNIPILEDSAEAIGSEYKGRKCGTFGTFGVFSFNGNKVITTSGGGALICWDPEVARKAIFYATQSRENKPYYWHEEIGYNYRLSNICAGIGRGQMEVLNHHLGRRKRNHTIYTCLLRNIEGVRVMQNPACEFNSNFWLTCITVSPSEAGVTVEQIRKHLDACGVESRLLWCPMHLQPVFKDVPFYGDGTSEQLFETGLCLPSGSSLGIKDVEDVGMTIMSFIFSTK